MPQSLRWQIVLALFGMVLVTVTLSWFMAVRFTERDFEGFVKDKAVSQARAYARLLEVRYNFYGGTEDLGSIISGGIGDNSSSGSPDGAEQGVDKLSILGWDAIIAEQLGIPLDTYQDALVDTTPARLAERYGSSIDALVASVMRQEVGRILRSRSADKLDAISYLAYVLGVLEVYVKEGGSSAQEALEAWTDKSLAPLLYGAPVLVVDTAGNLLSLSSASEAEIGFVERGKELDRFAIQDWANGETIGYVLSSRSPGALDAKEAGFLAQTRTAFLVAGMAAGAIAILLGVILARRITQPVSALRRSAVALSRGETAPRLRITKGELGSMSAAFNTMADALDQQSEVRSRMVSEISHELNTPLSVIQLEVEALKDGMQSPHETAERVLDELDVLRDLVTDVDSLAESEAGLLTIRKEQVDPEEFLHRAAQRWRIQAEAAGIELHVSAADDLGMIEMDSGRIGQALANLIRNALQHTPASGTIAVACKRRPVERLGGVWNTICVRDSGEGVSPADLERIFERSAEAEPNRTGRGLGLTIVRQIVTAHGGHVWAESPAGGGITFCIALP